MISPAFASVARRVTNLLSRGAVTLANAASKMQTLQVTLLADESKNAVEHFEPFGFTSCPQPGAEVIAAFIDGDRSHGVILVAADRRYRVQNLQPGEMAIFNAFGAMIKITQSGIAINGGGHPITITDAETVTVTGGNIIATGGDVIADGISLKTHHHNSSGDPI